MLNLDWTFFDLTVSHVLTLVCISDVFFTNELLGYGLTVVLKYSGGEN